MGLAEQVARLVDPKQASSEAGVAEAIESWQEKSDRLVRHGEAYKLPDAYKKVALKQIITGKTRENFGLWESEKYSYEDILRKVKGVPDPRSVIRKLPVARPESSWGT